MIKVTVDNFFDPDNAHLDRDTDVLRHISRDNVKEMKKARREGVMTVIKTPWLKPCCS